MDPKDKATETTEDAGLSMRDALEVAIGATKTDAELAADTPAKELALSPMQSSELEAPAEFNAEEKDDFKQLPRKQQEAQLRLHKSRQSNIEQIKAEKRSVQQERESLAEERKLVEDIRPFIKALGTKYSPQVALQKAVTMWKEFEEGDPKAKAAEYLEARGIAVPAELREGAPENSPKINPELLKLQNQVNALTSEKQREKDAGVTKSLTDEFSNFASTQNAAGKPRFPDITESEAGHRLSTKIGSLVSGRSDLSRQFIADAQERIPGLTYQQLMSEAYRYYGGRVDDSEATKSQSTREHLAQSRRAAASVPGGGGHAAGAAPRKKFKSTRDAMAAAIAELSD